MGISKVRSPSKSYCEDCLELRLLMGLLRAVTVRICCTLPTQAFSFPQTLTILTFLLRFVHTMSCGLATGLAFSSLALLFLKPLPLLLPVTRLRPPSIFFGVVGFAVGAVFYYESCISRAMDALNKYPELMVLHLRNNYPLDVMHSLSKGQIVGLWKGRWGRESKRRRMLGAAWQTAKKPIEVRSTVLCPRGNWEFEW